MNGYNNYLLITKNESIIEPRLLTRGHKTLRSKWLFEPWFSHQSSLYLDSGVAP